MEWRRCTPLRWYLAQPPLARAPPPLPPSRFRRRRRKRLLGDFDIACVVIDNVGVVRAVPQIFHFPLFTVCEKKIACPFSERRRSPGTLSLGSGAGVGHRCCAPTLIPVAQTVRPHPHHTPMNPSKEDLAAAGRRKVRERRGEGDAPADADARCLSTSPPRRGAPSLTTTHTHATHKNTSWKPSGRSGRPRRAEGVGVLQEAAGAPSPRRRPRRRCCNHLPPHRTTCLLRHRRPSPSLSRRRRWW